MLPSSLAMETLTKGLYIQQLNENITASNLANTYMDSNGYLMNSLEQVNVSEGIPYSFGNFTVESGPTVQSVTRLRSSFLDSQIQIQSSSLGYSEILANLLPQINAIVNSAAGTLDASLTTFANAWSALTANPTSIALRSAVVNAGIAFADISHNQFGQLQNLQEGLNGQINNSVTQINQILQQLSSLNKAILGSTGSNVNPLLDARDYALDRLARLINIQTNFGSNGTVTVYIGGSTLDLVDSVGASILQTNLMNPHITAFTNVSLQSSEGSQMGDVTSRISGGNLGGELNARDVVLPNYMTQVDQITTSVLNLTNMTTSAGYDSLGVTTGTNFFTGTGAQDINVNAAIVSDPTHALLPTALDPATDAVNYAANTGTIAQFMGNIRNLLANNFIVSQPRVGLVINPAASLASQIGSFATAPVGGSFTINGVTINYTTANSIDDILAMINTQDPNVQAVYNVSTQQFYMFSPNPITIANGSSNFTGWGQINNALTSTIRMNNGFAPNSPTIIYGNPPFATTNAALDSVEVPVGSLPPLTPAQNANGNTQAFRVTPGAYGTIMIDGVIVAPIINPRIGDNWANTQSLYTILNTINTAGAGGQFPGTTIGAIFNPLTQTITIYSAANPRPITINDINGNFTIFTGLNANTAVGNLSSGILAQVSTDVQTQQLVQQQDSAALTQLNNAQANIGGVATTPGQPGVPIAVIQQQALQSMIAFNASLEVLQVIDQMYSDLIGIIGPQPSGSFFQSQKG